jgi:hypothetical protein
MISATRGILCGVVFSALVRESSGRKRQPSLSLRAQAVFVSEPVVPTSTPAVRDLPDYTPDPNLFGLEAKRREDFGFIRSNT